MNNFQIYTDGGYFEKLDAGGWGVVIYQNNQEIFRASGWQKHTSSLEMELLAARKGIELLSQFEKTASTLSNTLYTDSRILIEGLTLKYPTWCKNQWKVKSGKTVVYKELWQSLSQLACQQNIQWQWVKAHSGNTGNTLADQLARDAVMQRIQ